MKKAYLFTGQGFQYDGMLQDLPKCRLTEAMLRIAADVLEEPIRGLDAKESLRSNRNVQLCIYISEVILGNLMIQKCIPDYVAGHSVGAFSAATISGALDYEDGLRLVQLRGEAMAKNYPTGYGMMVATGLTVELLEDELALFNHNMMGILEAETSNNKIYIANINTRQQVVLSGRLDQLSAVEKRLKEKYPVKTQFLKVNVPSHSALMMPVSAMLEEKINKIPLKQPTIPYVMNTTGRKTTKVNAIAKDLIFGVAKPVYWYDMICLLVELGVLHFYEISQSDTLTEMGKKIYSEATWRTYRFI